MLLTGRDHAAVCASCGIRIRTEEDLVYPDGRSTSARTTRRCSASPAARRLTLNRRAVLVPGRQASRVMAGRQQTLAMSCREQDDHQHRLGQSGGHLRSPEPMHLVGGLVAGGVNPQGRVAPGDPMTELTPPPVWLCGQLPGPPDDGDVPRRVHLGPVGDVPAGIDEVVQGVGVPDIGSGDLDALPGPGRLGCHEACPGGAVIGERELGVLRDDLHDQVRAAVARASLIRVGRRQQVPVGAAQAQLDMDIAVGLSPHAVDPADDGDAPFLHVQPER